MQRSSAMSPALAGKVTTRSISLWAFTLPDHLFRPVSTHFQLLYLVYYNMSVRFSSSAEVLLAWIAVRHSCLQSCRASILPVQQLSLARFPSGHKRLWVGGCLKIGTCAPRATVAMNLCTALSCSYAQLCCSTCRSVSVHLQEGR